MKWVNCSDELPCWHNTFVRVVSSRMQIHENQVACIANGCIIMHDREPIVLSDCEWLDERPMHEGLVLIEQEINRQIRQGDVLSVNAIYNNGELAKAAACYCLDEHLSPIHMTSSACSNVFLTIKRLMLWPWQRARINKIIYNYFKKADKITELTCAGAFIAVEIERLKKMSYK